MTSTPTPPATEPAAVSILTGNDVCDRCGFRALVGLVKEKGELMFCMHHGDKHADKMVSLGWTLVADDRPALYARESGPK